MKPIKYVALLFITIMMITSAYAADVTQGFTVTIMSKNYGIEIDNPVNNGIMCYVIPRPIAVGLPIHFQPDTLI